LATRQKKEPPGLSWLIKKPPRGAKALRAILIGWEAGLAFHSARFYIESVKSQAPDDNLLIYTIGEHFGEFVKIRGYIGAILI
jgi:hypothetical protein